MRAPVETFERARTLRRHLTLPEVLLWRELRGRRVGDMRFRRQHPIGPYVLDFYCPERRLAVEVDGAAHDILARASRDERRDEWLATRGIWVLRVGAADILSDKRRGDVLRTIAAAAPSPASGGPPPPLRG